MTRHELEEKIMSCIDELRQACVDYEFAGRDAALKDSEYRKAKAKAFLVNCGDGTKLTVAEKEARVDKACDDERLAAGLAEALRDSQREKVRSLQNELTAWQSLAANLRAEVSLAGMPERRY